MSLREWWKTSLASQFWWQFVRELVKQELASGQFEILLIHTVASFKLGHYNGGWTLQKSH